MTVDANLRLTLIIVIVACAAGMTANAQAADPVHFDEATVTRVEPVTRRVPTRVKKTRCDAGMPASARLETEYPDLADAIGKESGRLSRPRCHQMAETVFREEISGYRVVYRYDGTEYVRTLSYDPGDTLRVKVRVRPQTN